jgi:O-succinylbenzoic acid--CoA ligase
MKASAVKTLDFFGLAEGARVLLGLSVDYIAGKMMVVRALGGGLDLVLTEPSSRPLQKSEGSFSFVPMVPMQVIESLRAGDDLSRTAILLIGGGELPVSLKSRLGDFSVPEVYESFGMSETYTHFALRKLNGPLPDAYFSLLEGALIHTDARGCLVVDLPGVTAGPVVTNDLVKLREAPEEKKGASGFRWLGRIDNVIKTGGIKIIPEILEERIAELLGTTVLLLPFPDEKLGQKMVLLAEWNGRADPTAGWKEILTGSLPSHEVPRDFIPVAGIPRNDNFKPDRKAARALLRT